ncbi:MAG: AmmeMemoRadiSam system protein A [Acidimicrobiales bacterium]|nr:AmmeMemoRadiSam system protein A [Acidimicrobiales bacterium]
MTALIEPEVGRVLVQLAIGAIAVELGLEAEPVDGLDRFRDVLEQPAASFVSLHRGPNLLGCIGSIEPRRSLANDVAANAVAAAFSDPRLPAITIDDFRAMDVEVSVLGPLEPIRAGSFDRFAQQVAAGTDGLLVRAPGHRATLLPAVWAQCPDRATFLDLLWRKAGLGPRSWPEGIRADRYSTQEFHSNGPRRARPQIGLVR